MIDPVLNLGRISCNPCLLVSVSLSSLTPSAYSRDSNPATPANPLQPKPNHSSRRQANAVFREPPGQPRQSVSIPLSARLYPPHHHIVLYSCLCLAHAVGPHPGRLACLASSRQQRRGASDLHAARNGKHTHGVVSLASLRPHSTGPGLSVVSPCTPPGLSDWVMGDVMVRAPNLGRPGRWWSGRRDAGCSECGMDRQTESERVGVQGGRGPGRLTSRFIQSWSRKDLGVGRLQD